MEQGPSEPIRLYLDDDTEPFKVASAPLTFQFNTIALPDGRHRLRVEAPNGLAPPTVREIPFVVRNGVALTVSGLADGQTIAGQVQLLINAYAGSTEVEFEPKRAETPQPIPTWAWVLLLAIVAWSLFYVFNPTVQGPDAQASIVRPTVLTGDRIFMDTCARCHGEDGRGERPKVPPLRDANLALAVTPAPLLIKVTAGDPGSMMPEWGTRLTNEEIVSVVNHVRQSWGHDSSTIELRHRRPPAGIEALNRQLSEALKTKNADLLARCCTATGGLEPRIFRTDGVQARGAEAVGEAWRAYLADLDRSGAQVTQVSLPDSRYDYDPATVEQDGSVVIATGRLFVQTRDQQGREDRAKGRFIRVYQRLDGAWTLAFDFADIRMAVGCVPRDAPCPPGGEPAGTTTEPPAAPVATVPTPSATGVETASGSGGGSIGYA
ncbi:MAG: c-type cytochrome, partial [Planctomycetota bacterium]